MASDADNQTLAGSRRLSRRALLTRGAQAGAAFSGLSLLAGCGSSSSSSSASGTSASAATGPPPAGTVTFMNYPGYVSTSMLAGFNKRYPEIKIHQVAGDLSGDVQSAGQVIQNQSAYDMALLTVASIGQAVEAGVLEKPDFTKITNITNVGRQYRTAFPWGFPTDYGRVGFAYRKDLITERPTTWKEFWALIPKYSGKVVLAQYDRDVIGSSLLGLGYDANSTKEAELEAATQQVIKIKPHLLQFAQTNIAKPLGQGAAVLTLDWGPDAASTIASNKNIVWVNPKEGMTTYLEGWVAVKGTSKLAQIEAFMNFFMDPKHYAAYVNPIPCFGTIPSVKPYLLPSVRKNPALTPAPKSVKQYFETYLGEAGTKLWNNAWQEIQSA